MGDDPTVCVHGLGYVGLPTAAMLSNSGYQVDGFDTDTDKRRRLAAGNVDFEEPDLTRFITESLRGSLRIVEQPTVADFHLICVPTPYDRDQDRTDLRYVEAAVESATTVLRPGDTVVVESTVPPGTTAGRLRDVVSAAGFEVPTDVGLAYSPETVLPGDTLTELRTNDRLVGVVDESDATEVIAVYDSFVDGDIDTTGATTAEFVKLIQNAYRDVNIAFANEIAKLTHEFGIDAREAIRLANDHPRVDILNPGPGVGGHCIPIDPLFLSERSDVPLLIETARSVNDGMPGFVVELLTAAVGSLDGATVALLGVAYKGSVGDTRQSPSVALATRLRERGVSTIRITDPYVEDDTYDLVSLSTALADADAAVLATDHPEYAALDPKLFLDQMSTPVLVDTRGMLRRDRWEASDVNFYRL